MAGTTINGSVGGLTVAVSTSTSSQQNLATQVLNSAASVTPVVFATASGPLASKTAIASGHNILVSGATSVPSATLLLNGQGDVYISNGTMMSTVVAVDNTNSTMINIDGDMVAASGAGANVLAGMGHANMFTTGEGGQDVAYLYGATNKLTSNGSDGVLVGGPSTIEAAASGLDKIVMATGTTLSFINNSTPSAVDSIAGAAGAAITIAGTGNTSVSAGAGPESFFVDTASGNVTLAGNLGAADLFTFTSNGSAGTNQTTVAAFGAGDTVSLQGYAGYSLSTIAGNAHGSVLSLSDGSKVTFSNASAATVSAAIKLT